MLSFYLVDDPVLPEARGWTMWSNSNQPGISYAPIQCPEGEYVTDFSWHQEKNGFCDVKVKCSESGWSKHVTGCENWQHFDEHYWTDVDFF